MYTFYIIIKFLQNIMSDNVGVDTYLFFFFNNYHFLIVPLLIGTSYYTIYILNIYYDITYIGTF